MYIEHIMDRLATAGKYLFDNLIPVWQADAAIIESLADQIANNNGFTERQRGLALRLITKYKKHLADALKIDIDAELANPQFLFSIRILQGAKTISIQDAGDNQKKIVVKFPYDVALIEIIKQYKRDQKMNEYSQINWNADTRSWEYGYNEDNILHLCTFVDHGFTLDPELLDLASNALLVQENILQYIPMVTFEDNKFSYKNVVDHLPQPTSTNLIEVLLHAKMHGITHWDDAIELALVSGGFSFEVLKLLRAVSSPTMLNCATLLDIQDIIRYARNTLFIIPGGTELEHLKVAHAFLISEGYDASEITVAFRLDSSSGKICNEYIKDNCLNKPISDNTRFVFVSGKIPKPIIEANKQFDNVLHFGTNSAHYTLKNYIKYHHNVICLNILSNTTKEMNFGQL